MNREIPTDTDFQRSPERAAAALETTYDLAERDAEYIRETLWLIRLYARVWHRSEVRGLEHLPPTGPALVVGNHSGGVMTPDAPTFAVAFFERFGVERPLLLLSHDMLLEVPGAGALRKWGMMPASRANALATLRAGAVVIVFPGGDYDCFRPTCASAVIDFGGRKGFIDTALEADVPIVPVVSIGAQETQLFLTRGEWLARWNPLGSLLRAKIYPVAFGFPFGLSVGGLPPNLPLPAKLTTRVLEPIHLRRAFGAAPDRDEVYGHVVRVMQAALADLAAERWLPVLG